jgi:hypothetical protein
MSAESAAQLQATCYGLVIDVTVRVNELAA